MSWSDPCSYCGSHRAECKCGHWGETKPVVEQERATRNADADKKPQWSLVDFDSLVPMVRTLEAGAAKYGADNWKKGLGYRQILESALRHIFNMLNGEDIDKVENGGTGELHVGNALCNLMFLSYMMKHHPDMDDRGKERIKPHSSPKTDLLNALREKYRKSLGEGGIGSTAGFDSWLRNNGYAYLHSESSTTSGI